MGVARHLLLDRTLDLAFGRRVEAVVIHPVEPLDESSWRWELRERQLISAGIGRGHDYPAVSFVTDGEGSPRTFRLCRRALAEKLYHNDDADAALALRGVVRNLLDQLRERG